MLTLGGDHSIALPELRAAAAVSGQEWEPVIAVALGRGRVGLSDFGEAERSDPALLDLARRVRVEVDAECEADYPRRRGAKVALLARDGRRFKRHVPEPYGSASNPLTDAALERKFLDLAAPRLGGARAREALAMLWAVDAAPDAAPLAEALAL